MREIPLEEQRDIVRRHRRQATHALVGFIGRYQEQIEQLALERLTGIGFEQYGDAMFHQNPAELWRETMEELADAVNRRCVRIALDKGEL